MTRAETLAAIKDTYCQGTCREVEHDPLSCSDCAIAWLAQEIDHQSARALVAEQFKVIGLLGKSSYQDVVEQDLRVKLAEAQVEIERLRAEMARVDTHHVAQYLASRS